MATVTKVGLLGPPPAGGSYISTKDDPVVDRLLGEGWRLYREWDVEVPDPHPPSCGCDECLPDPFDTNKEARGER